MHAVTFLPEKGCGLVRKQNAGVWAGIVMFIFASVVFFMALSLDYYTNLGPGPGLLPVWLSGILMILSVLYVVDSVKKEVIRFEEILPKGRDLGSILAILGSVIVFMLIVDFTGFTIASTVLLFVMLVRDYKWYVGLGISAVVSISLFLVFQTFLGIPLPVNELGW
jgi:hypothetical protein